MSCVIGSLRDSFVSAFDISSGVEVGAGASARGTRTSEDAEGCSGTASAMSTSAVSVTFGSDTECSGAWTLSEVTGASY